MIERRLVPDKATMAAKSADHAANAIREAISLHDRATLVLATGSSQIGLLQHLVARQDIDWSKVTAFHLDEYVGLGGEHPASFHRYLEERFVAPLKHAVDFVPINGLADPETEAQRLGGLISGRRIDVCFAGLGENCHLAFNDPPADFETTDPFLVVRLDESCRRQQHRDGWFPTLEAVPHRAITMSVRQIMKAALIVVSVSGARKAQATRDALEGPVTPLHPASILQQHPNTVMFLDPAAASLLNR